MPGRSRSAAKARAALRPDVSVRSGRVVRQVPRQQIIHAGDLVVWDAGQRIGEPSLRVTAIPGARYVRPERQTGTQTGCLSGQWAFQISTRSPKGLPSYGAARRMALLSGAQFHLPQWHGQKRAPPGLYARSPQSRYR